MAGLKFTCTDENGLIYQCDEDDLTAILIGTNDKNIENVEIPQGVAPEGGDYWKIIAIGAKAFQGTKIKTVSMPYIVTIYHDAFQNCSNLTTVSNTQNLTTIDYNAFASCINLNSFEFSNCITSIGSSAFENTGFSEIELSGDITIDFKAFANCEALTDVVLSNISSIGQQAFVNCKSLTTVEISNILSMGNGVFSGCENLKTAVVDVTNIPSGLFENCKKLVSLEIGDNVISIGSSAFKNCRLSNINLPYGLQSIGAHAFNNCPIGELVIPNSVSSLDQSAFAGMEALTSITLDNNIFKIPKYCFMGCYSLETITLPNSVGEIEDNAFQGCLALKTVTLGSNVHFIGDKIFLLSNKINKIISLNPEPPNVGYDTFNNYKVTLEVPISSLEAYKSHAIWGKFTTINGFFDPDNKNSYENGIYIFCKNDKMIKPEYWLSEDSVVGVALITDHTKALIALENVADNKKVVWGPDGLVKGVISTANNKSNSKPGDAKDDYYGENNTKLMIADLDPEEDTALSLAHSYRFSNGSNGYLPALGELIELFEKKEAVNKVMKLVGGEEINDEWYWSSTQHYLEYRAWAYGGYDSQNNRWFAQLRNEKSPKADTYGAAYILVRPFGVIPPNTKTDIDIIPLKYSNTPVYYSIDGIRYTSPKKGLNIVRMSDGSTKKIIIK